jgi:hypothetical protein
MHAVVETDLPEINDVQLEVNNSDPDLDDFQLDVVYVLVGYVLAFVMTAR